MRTLGRSAENTNKEGTKVMKFYLVLLALWLGAVGMAQEVLTLAKHGEVPDYTIVHAADAGDSVKLACQELQKYIAIQTGVTLPIQDDSGELPAKAILVGSPRYLNTLPGCDFPKTHYPDDSFTLKAVGPHLVIHGGKRGALYGACEVLERFGGCRWYASWHSVTPQLQAFTVPANLEESQEPAFMMRDPYWYDMFRPEMAYHNKDNGSGTNLYDSQGGKIRFGGGMFVHTMNNLVPVNEFFESHPEYFAEIDGKRQNGYVQRCLSNPDVLRIVIERTLANIRKDPNATLFSVSQNDVNKYCTCPNCNAIAEQYGGQSGLLIWFVNQVAEAVEKEFPNALIETLAYHYTRTPPVNIRPRDNVVVRLCTIECDFASPLDVSTAPQNKKFVDDIQKWSSLTDKLFIWDYTTNYRHYIGPFPNFGCLQGNVKFFRDNHVISLMEQGAYQGQHAEFAELRGWLLAKLLWNPEIDVNAAIDDFMHGYYGDAAPLVREYFDKLQNLVQDPNIHLGVFDNLNASWLTAEFLDDAVKLWQEAEERTKSNPVIYYNVCKSAIPVHYARYMKQPSISSFEYVWDNDGVCIDPIKGKLASELLKRFDAKGPEGIGKQKIFIAESGNDSHAQWEKDAKFYPTKRISSDDFTVQTCPELGMCIGSITNAAGIELLNPRRRGIILSCNYSSIEKLTPDKYELEDTGTSTIKGTYKSPDGINTTLSIGCGKDMVTEKILLYNTSDKPRLVAPVISASINLGETDNYFVSFDQKDVVYVLSPNSATLGENFSTWSKATSNSHSFSIQAHNGHCVTFNYSGCINRASVNFSNTKGMIDILIQSDEVEITPNASIEQYFNFMPFEKPEVKNYPVPKTEKSVVKSVILQDTYIRDGFNSKWMQRVRDPEASDLSALKLFNSHNEWCVQIQMENFQNMQLDSSKKYTLRAKVKVIPRLFNGGAFAGGVYDSAVKKNNATKVDIKECEPYYRYYTLAEHWSPQNKQKIWMAPPNPGPEGSAIECVYLDYFECVEE